MQSRILHRQRGLIGKDFGKSQLFSREVARALVKQRDRSLDSACEGCVRITVGSTEQMDQLLSAIRETIVEIGALKEVSA